jgi:hypothetical protein
VARVRSGWSVRTCSRVCVRDTLPSTRHPRPSARCSWRVPAPELPPGRGPSLCRGRAHAGSGACPRRASFGSTGPATPCAGSPAPLSSRDDVVPVDWVADSLLFLLLKPTLQHRRYHVTVHTPKANVQYQNPREFSRFLYRRTLSSGNSGSRKSCHLVFRCSKYLVFRWILDSVQMI